MEEAERDGSMRGARQAHAAARAIESPSPRRFSLTPGVVAIGASTGGPQALVALIKPLAWALDRLPICVSLHMPPDLMPIIAAHVARTANVPTRIVRAAMPFEIGTVYFAPGDRHLDLRRSPAGVEIDLTPERPRDFCKPAVDSMFTAVARAFGARSLGVVLSGMGKDGLVGSQAIVAAGGAVMVQDKKTSAVWGMPGAVADAELTTTILPPEELAREIIRRLQPSWVPR